MASIQLRDDDLPDADLSYEGGYYTVTLVGLTGLVEKPRELTIAEGQAGILSAKPPSVRAKDKRFLEALLLRAVEIGTPDGLLDNDALTPGKTVLDKQLLLLAQLTRVVRRALLKLEKPQ